MTASELREKGADPARVLALLGLRFEVHAPKKERPPKSDAEKEAEKEAGKEAGKEGDGENKPKEGGDKEEEEEDDPDLKGPYPRDASGGYLWHILYRISCGLRIIPPRRRLPEFSTLDDVLALFRARSKTLVLTGAGVSVSVGIPDFRSENGLYARLREEFDLPGACDDERERFFFFLFFFFFFFFFWRF
jgi:hypothetical protein